jgi:hypothetical protein
LRGSALFYRRVSLKNARASSRSVRKMSLRRIALAEHVCLNDEQVERYFLWSAESENEVVEAKLFVCERCRDVFRETAAFINGIREALRSRRVERLNHLDGDANTSSATSAGG